MQQRDLGRSDDGLFKMILDNQEFTVDAIEKSELMAVELSALPLVGGEPDGVLATQVAKRRLESLVGRPVSIHAASGFMEAIDEALDIIKKNTPMMPDSPTGSTLTPEPLTTEPSKPTCATCPP